MANEVSISGSLACSKSGASVTGAFSFNADLSGTEMIADVQQVTNTASPLAVTGLGSFGYLLLKNMGVLGDITTAANEIIVALDSAATTQLVGHIKPGGGMILAKPPVAMYVKCATAVTVQMFVVGCEN
jgi:hypothetical protein